MELTLSQQRQQLDEAARSIECKIHDLEHKRAVLIRAFNEIDNTGEDMLSSETILAQETRKIMSELINS